VLDAGAADQVLDGVHAVLGDGVVGQVELGEAEWGQGYGCVSRMLISFMMVLTPSRIEFRFSI
jgi:hypothetical protein